jgi:hypothetical protein
VSGRLGDFPEGVAPWSLTGRPVLRQVTFVPAGAEARETHAREVRALHPGRTARTEGAASAVEAVTGQAVVTLEERDLSIHLVDVRNRQMGVAGSAPGRGEAHREHGFGPVIDVAVGVGAHRRPPLTPVARGASELHRVMGDVGVRAE